MRQCQVDNDDILGFNYNVLHATCNEPGDEISSHKERKKGDLHE